MLTECRNYQMKSRKSRETDGLQLQLEPGTPKTPVLTLLTDSGACTHTHACTPTHLSWERTTNVAKVKFYKNREAIFNPGYTFNYLVTTWGAVKNTRMEKLGNKMGKRYDTTYTQSLKNIFNTTQNKEHKNYQNTISPLSTRKYYISSNNTFCWWGPGETSAHTLQVVMHRCKP